MSQQELSIKHHLHTPTLPKLGLCKSSSFSHVEIYLWFSATEIIETNLYKCFFIHLGFYIYFFLCIHFFCHMLEGSTKYLSLKNYISCFHLFIYFFVSQTFNGKLLGNLPLILHKYSVFSVHV